MDTAPRIALVNMPFISAHRPTLATALLKAVLQRCGLVCDVHNLYLRLAERLDLSLYEHFAIVNDKELAGERVFSAHVFGPDFVPELAIPAGFESNDPSETPESIKQRIRMITAGFLEDCMTHVSWEQYRVVGFSTVFQQNLASLALAKRIKERWPNISIVFGGANCESEMGHELHRRFPFIDYVCTGEGDKVFPELVQSILANRQALCLPGVVGRSASLKIMGASVAVEPVKNLDELPFPNYDDYFEQLRASSLDLDGTIDLPFETSRGCWYGATHHCTFCGLNDDTIVYRSKSPTRASQEINFLASHYGVRRLTATDDILDRRYLTELLPDLEHRQPKLSIFYETKANLRKEHLAALKRAGIDRLQPGIESLSTPILQLMRKGCTVLQNLQTLKWASELGIQVFWNFLAGFPGEDPHEYIKIAEMIPSILHLSPPVVAGFIRLDRFSPYFTMPEKMGITRVRPSSAYFAIYPFPEESLRRLAYFFQYDYVDGRDPRMYAAPAMDMMRHWQRNYCAYSFASLTDGDRLILRDRRPCATETVATLTGVQRTVFEYLDSAHPLPAIKAHLFSKGHDVNDHTLREELADWRRKRWIVLDGDSYLALAVRMDDIY